MTEDTDDTREREDQHEDEPPATGRADDEREDGGPAADDPLGDLARQVREKRERDNERASAADGFEELGGAAEDAGPDGRPGDGDAETGRAGDELFEEMDVSDVDTDAVWESVLDDESDGHDGRGGSGVDVGTAAAADVESTASDDHVVPKGDYCESCRFFSAPPTVECTYEGAEIVEVVDMEQFRVRNCPVVSGLVDTDGAVFERDDEADAGETPSD